VSSINSITLIGRLGRDPELRYTQTGKAVVSFSLAVDRRQKGETDWFQVTAWDKLAELCNEHLRKGRQAAVRGRMQSRTYEAQDGSKRTSWEVVAEDVQFLGGREEQEAPAAPPQQQPQRPTPQRQASPATRQVVQQAWGPLPDDDGVPF
jgi:single-strand DNA-binding protein